MTGGRPNVLVLASTFPRRRGDSVPSFVFDLAKETALRTTTYVLAPHDSGARFREDIDGVHIYRFPYFFYETLAYRGGMVNRFRESTLAKVQLPFFLLSMSLYSLYLIFTKRIEIVHAHWLFPQGFVASLVKKITGVKLIITTHGGDVEILRTKLVAKLIGNVVEYADKVTFVSRRNLDYVQETYMGKRKINTALLPMGVWLPSTTQPIRRDMKNLLFVGRLVKLKGLHVLLQSLHELIPTSHNLFHLDVIGDGPSRSLEEKLVEELGLSDVVSFHGYVTGPPKEVFFANADLVVVPSIIDQQGHQEGLPVVALEALAHGRPLIASATGGLPELINGGNGILVPPGDSGRLAEAVFSLAYDYERRVSMSHAAQETIRMYTWDRVATECFRIMLELHEQRT